MADHLSPEEADDLRLTFTQTALLLAFGWIPSFLVRIGVIK